MEFNSYHVLQLLLCELAEEVPLEFQRGIAQTPPEFLTAAPLLWHSSQCLNIQEGVSKNWTLHSATEIRTWALIRDKLLFCRGRQKLLALPTHDINNGQKRMSVPVVCVWVCCFVRCVCVCAYYADKTSLRASWAQWIHTSSKSRYFSDMAILFTFSDKITKYL